MTTVNLSPTKDSTLHGYAPEVDTNLSTDVSLHLRNYGSPAARFVIAFDYSTIPSGATINSASLAMTCSANPGPVASACSIYPVLRSWVNAQVTWNSYSTGNAWGTAGCANTSTDRSATAIATFNLPNGTGAIAVTNWNTTTLAALFGSNDLLGFLVKADSEAGSFDNAEIRSQDWTTAGERPLFTIDYTAAAAKAPPPNLLGAGRFLNQILGR